MPLESALAIDGVESVAVIGEGRFTWSAGIGEPDAAAVSGLAAAAAALVRPEEDFGDVLVTTGASFHVLRRVDKDRVAHLVLRRGAARLAMARHEFKVLVDRYATADERPAPVVQAPAPEPEPEVSTAGLPRRRPDRRRNGPPAAAVAHDLPPAWLDLVGQPYETDDGVLDRILGTLKQL